MMRLITWAVLLCLAAACSNSEGEKNVSIDDQERATAWSATWDFDLKVAETSNEIDRLEVVGFKSSTPMQELVDQLYETAFTGDANVYGPTLFGQMDLNRPLDPKALLEELKRFDTVMVEDLETGDLVDTVVDFSFNLKKVSAVMIGFRLHTDQDFALDPLYVGIGAQVFDETTGDRRGDSPKFFLGFEDEVEEGLRYDKLKIYSDSLGFFRPTAFEVYREETAMSLTDYVSNKFGKDAVVRLHMKLMLAPAKGLLLVEEVKIDVKKPEMAMVNTSVPIR